MSIFTDWSQYRFKCHGGDDYHVSECLPTKLLKESPNFPKPPPFAAWWFLPVENKTEPGWYHIVGSRESAQSGQLLSFNLVGDVYPTPYYTKDEANGRSMRRAEFRLVDAEHDVATTGGEKEGLFYIVCGDESGKKGDMVYIARALVGDWLNTWKADFTDPKATWKLIPAVCGVDATCDLPDFEAHYEEYRNRQSMTWWVILLIILGVCLVCGCSAETASKKTETGRRYRQNVQRVTTRMRSPRRHPNTATNVPVQAVVVTETVVSSNEMPVVDAIVVPHNRNFI